MTPEVAVAEAAVLDSVLPQLEADGFEVYRQPAAHLLPPFMQASPPDAIAFRKDRKLAIEVARKGARSEKRLAGLREVLSGHRDWELRVYWVSPANAPEPIDGASRRDIDQAIGSIDQLTNDGLLAPALLMSWAALEALGRALLPEMLVRPQTPGRLVEILATEGYVTPSEADRLRELSRVRNRLIHGGLQVKIASKDIRAFRVILKALLDLLRSERASR
jgi:uncharacterized protein YutE (UPF0331/DUF86 family)